MSIAASDLVGWRVADTAVHPVVLKPCGRVATRIELEGFFRAVSELVARAAAIPFPTSGDCVEFDP